MGPLARTSWMYEAMRLADEEEVYSVLDFMTAFDDDMWEKVAAHDWAVMGDVIQAVTKHRVQLKAVRTQYRIRAIEKHSVCLDGWAEDSTGLVYDVEMQSDGEGFPPERADHYQAMLEHDNLKKGASYKSAHKRELVIFSKDDMAGQGKMHYTVAGGPECYRLGYTIHLIYVYGDAEGDKQLAGICAALLEPDSDKIRVRSIRRALGYFKKAKEGRRIMCKALSDLCDKREKRGIETGEKNFAIRTVKSMAAMGMDFDVISNALGLSKAVVMEYVRL